MAEAEKIAELFVSTKPLLEQARESRENYDIEKALEIYFQVEKVDSQLQIMSADDWNYLCWYGSLKYMAEKVINACEKAVSLDPNNGSYIDSRGLNRALTGNISGAIKDFEAYTKMIGSDPYHRQKRLGWIEALRSDDYPFSKKEIQYLFWE